MSGFSTQEVRDWLVTHGQWSPTKGFVGTAQVTYNAAVQFGVTDSELDRAMNLPAGTVSTYLRQHGMPPLSAATYASNGSGGSNTLLIGVAAIAAALLLRRR